MNFIRVCLTILCCKVCTVSTISTKNQDKYIEKFIEKLLKSEKFIELTSKLADDIAEKVRSVKMERNMLRSGKKDKLLRTDGNKSREHKRPKSEAPEIKMSAHDLLEAMRNNPLFKKDHITLKFKELTKKLQNLTENKEKEKKRNDKKVPENAEKDEKDIDSDKSATINDKDDAETELDKEKVNLSFDSEHDEKQKLNDSSDNSSTEDIIDDIIDETSKIVETDKDIVDDESRHSGSNEKDIGGRKSHKKSLDINVVQRAGKAFEKEETTVEPVDVDRNKTNTKNKTEAINTEINISAEKVNNDAEKSKVVSIVTSTVADKNSYESKKVREENGKLYKYLSSPEYQDFHEKFKKEETNSVLIK